MGARFELWASWICLVGCLGCGRYDFELSASDAGGDASVVGRETWTFGEAPGARVTGVTADTFLCAGPDEEDLNWGASGRFEGGSSCTGLLRFALTAVPAGATAVEASVEVWPQLVPSVAGTIDVHRITEAWVEGEETGQPGESSYLRRLPSVDWSRSGARPPDSADPTELHEFNPTRFEAQVIPLSAAVVQGWLDDPSSNHGLGFFGSGYGAPDSEHPHFLSREATEAEMRPVLILTFDQP